jgi:deazaflavin-dependent oxidoreductase (nitroreductase family)
VFGRVIRCGRERATTTAGSVNHLVVVLLDRIVLGRVHTVEAGPRPADGQGCWSTTSVEEFVVRTAISKAAGTLVLVVSVTGIVFVAGMRAKSPAVVNGVRKLGRATRPLTIKSAGGPGAYASVVHHIGRTSGRSYSTPVAAVPIDDGFVVALPYGLNADWFKNVLASGSATIDHDGIAIDVDRPEVVPLSAVEHQFSPGDQRAHRLFGVDQCLRVHRTVPRRPERRG